MEEIFDVLGPNGVVTGKTASRTVCHTQGLWHKAIAVFLINSRNQVLLQKRSLTKRLWPGQWDISAGGHVLAGEFGFQAAIRECKEELGIHLCVNDLIFIGGTTSINQQDDIINKHFNEYYIARKDYKISDLTLQPEEVSEVKWVNEAEIVRDIKNNYHGITDKVECWDYLALYYDWQKSHNLSLL